MRAHLLFAGIAAAYASLAYAGEEPRLGFAGFGAATRIDDVRQRYPNSLVTESYIHVAAEDSTDQIFGIAISKEQVLLIFERKSSDGQKAYPFCDDVYDRISSMYGDPNAEQNFREEALKVQRRIWRRGDERMALRCFWRDGVVYAERVELYKVADGAL
ncbi:MAG TPA: hypothetical protein VH814_09735 [Steroidobacteraceae bacterium]|jgi:hypothetical protein